MKKLKIGLILASVSTMTIFGAITVFADNLVNISTACEQQNGVLYGFNDGFSNRKKCAGEDRRVVLIGQQGPKGDKGDPGPKGDSGPQGSPGPTIGKPVFDLQQVRGAGLDIDASTTPLKTPGDVTVNCPSACTLWVNYDVDTRNTQSPGVGSWYQHLYMIYVDGVDQAVYNQVSAVTPNAAYPVAVNGVFPVSAGSHTVSVWVKVTGGHLQQFTSHLQTMAVQQ